MGRLRIAALVSVFSLCLFPGLQVRAQEIPPALEGWQEWVLEGREYLDCPFWMNGSYGNEGEHPCAWPHRLRLTIGAQGGEFAVTWTAYAESWLPLPGGGEQWPQKVRVNGVERPVTQRGGMPSILVAPGRYRLEGELQWERRPESIRVPDAAGLVDLILDGERVFPLQRSGGAVWLGRAQAAQDEADALAVEIYRKLSDGLPPILETRLRLQVSGQGREEVLGPILPEGFVPMALASPIPALLDQENRLRIQLQPGNWQIQVVGRASQVLSSVSLGEQPGPWPSQEIWSYQSDPRLRVTAASGGSPVDPAQADVPGDWRQLPAFALGSTDTLEIEERSRGMADDANRLTLSRELWLDFQGRGMTARDVISGQMVRDFRLDLAAPFELRRAQSHGQPLLVTKGDEEGSSGVELRNSNVDLKATSWVSRSSGALPVTGWHTSFEGVRLRLHLPPGRELLAAPGADSSPDAWIDRWSLLDVFLLLVTTLLAGQLLGRRWAVLACLFLALSYHESMGPLWCLLVVLALALVHRALPSGRLQGAVGLLQTVAVLALALVLLPFVAGELRLVVYPQLERYSVGSWTSSSPFEVQALRFEPPDVGLEMMDMAVAPSVAEEVEADAVEQRVQVAAAPKRQGKVAAMAQQQLQRYALSNVFQAGGGEPGWTWREARLSWSGPILPDQTLRLIVAPRWLTRFLRLLMVGFLGALLWRLATPLRQTLPPMSGKALAVMLLPLALSSTALVAQAIPDPALLEELRTRLTRAPDCVPHCGGLERAYVEVKGERLAVRLTFHALESVALPLPGAAAAWKIGRVVVDGQEKGEILRRADGSLWLPVERGVHGVEVEGSLLSVDRFDLRFPVSPRWTSFVAEDWDVSGLREGRLLTDRLGFARRETRRESPGLEAVAAEVPPFVLVTRELDMDLDWTVTTTVRRLAPQEGSLTLALPILPGESVLTPGLEVLDGSITVALAAGEGSVSWRSRLDTVDEFAISFPRMESLSETWRFLVSPQWSARFSGVPASYPESEEGYWVHEFHPLPGETLEVLVSRPEALSGATLAIDGARLWVEAGRRATEHSLALTLRSTRGGQHTLGIPEDGSVLEVLLDGTSINVRPEQGSLTVPIRPGEQKLEVRWRDNDGAGTWLRTPAVDLGAEASNLELSLALPQQRWVLLTRGPEVGPAVLYWGELLVLALVAWLLARLGRTPLRFSHWLLLGLGFSTYSWWVLVAVVAWLLALDMRSRITNGLRWWSFDLMQLAIFGMTLVAMGCLASAIPMGLLGSPDMHVTGNGSSAHELNWFQDASSGEMPTALAFTLPVLGYRLAMLAWALWLASAVVGWLRWGWGCATTGGYWRWREKPLKAEPAPVEKD